MVLFNLSDFHYIFSTHLDSSQFPAKKKDNFLCFLFRISSSSGYNQWRYKSVWGTNYGNIIFSAQSLER